MSPDARIAAIAAAQYGAFSAPQARGVGLSPDAIKHRVRTGRWTVLHRGVYAVAGVPGGWRQRAAAARLALGPRAAVSHLAAAVLHGFLPGEPAPIDVVLPHGQHRASRKGIRVHQAILAKSDLRTVEGIRVTAPNRTLVDIASVLRADRIESAVDTAAVKGLISVPALDRYISARGLGSRPGVGRLRTVLRDRATGKRESEFERRFLRRLRRAGLPEPVAQLRVGRRRIDLAYPDAKVAVELDGLAYHFSGAAFRDGLKRDKELIRLGWTPVHVTWDEMERSWDEIETTLRGLLGCARVG